jgi:sterol desaturase/sphingolipid hydroxylase (fatty acid hydroxylase superfamily)
MHLVIHTFLALLIVVISDWCKSAHFGIVYWTGAGVLGSILISFLALDFFGGWAVHITEHKLRFLWRFHIVHHADNNVDVTTGLRHHPVESVLRGLFFFFGILLAGSPMYAVMIYQTFLILFVSFTHANINLLKKQMHY